MEKFRSKLYGKAASYLVNAYVDAMIEEALVYYVKHSQIQTSSKEVKERVVNIVKKTSPANKKQRLIVKAFTYKWANGYANYWYSKFLYKLVRRKLPQEKDYYMEMRGLMNNFATHLVKIIFLYPILIKRYAKKRTIKITLNKEEIRKEVLEVQKINIKVNSENAIKIGRKETDIWKIRQLVKWSARTKNPEIFLRSAVLGQLNASKWDKIYSFLIN